MRFKLSYIFEDTQSSDDTINTLLEFSRGNISVEELKEEIPFIREVILKEPLAQSRVFFNFDSLFEVANMLNLPEESLNLYEAVMEGYMRFDVDYKFVSEFEEGSDRIFQNLDIENIELVDYIKDYYGEPYYYGLGYKLYNIFFEESLDLISAYVRYWNPLVLQNAQEFVPQEKDEIFEDTGFELNSSSFLDIETTIAKLIELYFMSGHEGNLESLVKSILHKRGSKRYIQWSSEPDYFESARTYNNWDKDVKKQYNDEIRPILQNIVKLLENEG